MQKETDNLRITELRPRHPDSKWFDERKKNYPMAVVYTKL